MYSCKLKEGLENLNIRICYKDNKKVKSNKSIYQFGNYRAVLFVLLPEYMLK